MKKMHGILFFLCVIFLLSGLGLLLYSPVNAWLREGQTQQRVETFQSVTNSRKPTVPDTTPPVSTEAPTIPYAALRRAMETYNRSIFENAQSGLCDAWSYQAPVFDLAEYGIEDGVVGILSIPKMDLELPIYLGATSEHLAGGAAQLSQTSMPIGGINTNCVLAGHRGWYGALFFRHIELLEIGDAVLIDIDDSWTERILHITISAKTAEEMRTYYHFSDYQNEALDALLAEQEAMSDLLGNLSISQEEALALLQNLPADLSPERKAVVRHALSLVGRVNYFWGGKSLVLGWDSRWGQLQLVWAEGSETTGTYRPYGLDCSGFVDWVFYNASDCQYGEIITAGSNPKPTPLECSE